MSRSKLVNEKVAVVLLSGGNPRIAKADGDAQRQPHSMGVACKEGTVCSELENFHAAPMAVCRASRI